MSRLVSDLKHSPGAGKWIVCLAATIVLLVPAWFVLPEFTDLDSRPDLRQLFKIAAVALLFPAFVEEFVFRGLINWNQSGISILLSTILFVLWHPFGGRFLVPEAQPYLTNYRFLLFATVFGLLWCGMRKWTGSLWPSIVSHWLVVVTWKALGGAQFLTN